jgi:glucose-1-phosphate cytidylyltransferase
MVAIGGKPILWHILKIFSSHGINEFIICLGYKGFIIKEFFANYFLHMSDVTFDIKNNRMDVHRNHVEPWRVSLVDTGEKTMTGGRLKRVSNYIGDETFCFTYGDGVSDVNITSLINFHKEQKTLATLTAVQPPGRFGVFSLSEGQTRVLSFKEKPSSEGAWISGGFFVLEPGVMDYIKDDSTVWEKEPLENMASSGMLSAYRHHGFWHPLDTLHDKYVLEEMWQSGNAPWKVW